MNKMWGFRSKSTTLTITVIFLLVLSQLALCYDSVVYAASGDTEWASTTVSEFNSSKYGDVAVDASGNSFYVGSVSGQTPFDFGNGISITGTAVFNNAVLVKYNTTGVPEWAKLMITNTNLSEFYSVALDAAGNIYGSGRIQGVGTYDFGNGVTAVGTGVGNNSFVVKFNSSGVAQWANITTIYTTRLTVDPSGNVYIASTVYADSTYDFGNGVTIAANGNSGIDVLVVKYNTSGVAQWAKSNVAGGVNDTSIYNEVAVDSTGNVYAVGSVHGNHAFNFEDGVTVTGVIGDSAILTKYNSAGVTQWVKIIVGPDTSEFVGVTVDSSDNFYVCGIIQGSGSFDFGNGVSVNGGSSSWTNGTIIKYSAAGVAQWAKSTTSGADESFLYDISVDSVGNVFAVGEFWGTAEIGFSASAKTPGVYSQYNAWIIKLNSTGVPQWVKSAVSGSDQTMYAGVANDPAGNIYVAGEFRGSSAFTFGNGVSVTAPADINALALKYAGETVTPVISVTPVTPASPTSPSSPVIPKLPATGAEL